MVKYNNFNISCTSWPRGYPHIGRLREPQKFAIRVDRLSEDNFAAGRTDFRFSRRRRHRRDFGDSRERRIVWRGHIHFHFVADRQRRIQGALKERARPVEMNSAVLGRWLISAVKNRNFAVFFYVVVTRRPVLHFLLDELVQRTITGHSTH